MKPIHCAWCGGDFPPTKKDRPKQHRANGTTCCGSGQVRRNHDAINEARIKNAISTLDKSVRM